MPEQPASEKPQPKGSTPASRPAPPPFRPNKELIGYIEEGQKPPLRCGDAPSPADMDDFAGCLRAKAVELPRLRGMLVALAERVEGTADAVRREAA